ncbi:Uncharacterised protein [Legionella steigerwaltii]|uniref:Uncharacterized protein n=1 Tax=Legionella steigerwaltii TaxID=460 RepID=A0A378L9M7_9GAMM|nr:hypothetical protein [Legionella steigerwaltii]KTD80801.1 hypothetical protein Lstg_0028 [Legionella steigerwaltii]STY23513.1 Uncharacterised protein [Legionella steigerwaltii]
MQSRLTQLALNPLKFAFNKSVLSSLRKTHGSLFFPDKLDISYPRLSSIEINEGISQLHDSLPSGKNFLFRGTEGTKEVHEAMTTDYLGWSSVQRRKAPSHDLVDYLVSNNSRYFFSASPCKYTVRPYAAGISIVPCKGYIWVIGLPKVYTIPQKHLFLNEEMFDSYSRRQIQQLEEGEKYHPIKRTTADNNEVTVIVGARKEDNWALKVSEDVAKIIQVRGPGRLLGKFMSSDEIVHVQDWTNPGFKKRVWSLEIVFSEGIKAEHYDKMNARARELGLIGSDERLLTLDDASSVVDSKELEELNTHYTTTETHRVLKVHKGIPLGHKESLIEYMVAEIQGSTKLEELVRCDHSYTL